MNHSFMALMGIFGISIAVTLGAWGWVFGAMGTLALWTVINLTILEVTFSFDNAVVNAKWLKTMSRFWQTMFLTVGIFIAVFVVRFVLPIFIVMLTAGEGFFSVIDMATNNPELYAKELHEAGPMIDSFGGTFLIMIGLNYFLDHEKDVHWIKWLESRLAPFGRYNNLVVFLVLLFQVITFSITGNGAILMAGICGIALYEALDLFDSMMGDEDDPEETNDSAGFVHPAPKSAIVTAPKVGMAAFIVFIRLEVLDASFSFDGVIGAFALTSNIWIIMAGLAAGAMWVRSLTVYLVRAGTMENFRYLESGAHWAISVLGLVMLFKLYHLEMPEVVIGSIGLVFIVCALIASIRANKRDAREQASLEQDSQQEEPQPQTEESIKQ